MSRWTDLAEWRGPSPNTGDGDSNPDEPADAMYEYRGVVVHIAVGYYEGTIAWQHNADANVSSHFVVARSGRIAQVVDTAIRAWTQGVGNGRWLSVENEGFLLGDRRNPGDWHLLSPAMVEANARLLARAHREYGVPLQLATSPTGRGLGYHSMGAENGYNWGHSACPGEPIKAQLPAVLARAKEIVGGDMALRDEKLSVPAETLKTGERIPASGAAVETFDAATAVAYTLRHAFAARRAAEDALAKVAELAGRPPVQAAPVDAATMKAALLDPEVLRAIAVEVANEQHRRTES